MRIVMATYGASALSLRLLARPFSVAFQSSYDILLSTYTHTLPLGLGIIQVNKKGGRASSMKEQSLDNLWLAQMLWDLGAVQFGNFTVSESAVSSPVFVNPKVLISNPGALRVASKLMQQEINLAQSLRRPRVHPFNLVAGVPVGGLLLASAYSLETNIPLIYARSRPEGTGKRGIEGRFTEGDSVLIIDDLITRGSSILETASLLEENGLKVKDVIVLVDREHGAAERLRRHGYNLLSILKLDVMLNHYMSKGYISEETYRTCAEYLQSKQGEINNSAS